MPCHFDSFILSHSKRLMSEVVSQIGGFYNNSLYYGVTDGMYIPMKYWSELVDNGFVGKSPDLCKNDYRNSGIFYAWFLAPKIKLLFGD